jgi:membrane protein DedA with SNARE-associated domain
MSCGMWDVPLYKFLLIDGTAALISVPTQVLLAAFYGEQIKATIKEFNIIVISTVIIGVGLYFVYKLIQKKNSKTA